MMSKKNECVCSSANKDTCVSNDEPIHDKLDKTVCLGKTALYYDRAFGAYYDVTSHKKCFPKVGPIGDKLDKTICSGKTTNRHRVFGTYYDIRCPCRNYDLVTLDGAVSMRDPKRPYAYKRLICPEMIIRKC